MKKIIAPTIITAVFFLTGCSENEEVAEGTGTAANENAVQQETNTEEVEENEANEEENTDNNGIEEEEEAEEENEVKEEETGREFDEDFHQEHDNEELYETLIERFDDEQEAASKARDEEGEDSNFVVYDYIEGSKEIYESDHNTLEVSFEGEPAHETMDGLVGINYIYTMSYRDGEGYNIMDTEAEVLWE